MSTPTNLRESVAQQVTALLESKVFVISHPPKGTPRECPTGVYDEVDEHGKTWHVHSALLDVGVRWTASDDEYERQLGETRIDITREGHMALVASLGGECPECGLAKREGEPHGPGADCPSVTWQAALDEGQLCEACAEIVQYDLQHRAYPAGPFRMPYVRSHPSGQCGTCGGSL